MKFDPLTVVAVLNAFTAAVSLATLVYSRQTSIHTNSITDKLEAKTHAISHMEGKEEGRLEGEAKAATLAEGKLIAETNVARTMAMPEANGNGKPDTVVLHDDAKTTKAVVKTKKKPRRKSP